MNAVNDFISSVPRVWRGDGISFQIMENPEKSGGQPNLFGWPLVY